MQEVEGIIRDYHKMKKQLNIAKFQLELFSGISESDIIESMSFSHPVGERVSGGGISDKTAKIAISLETRKEQMNSDLYDFYYGEYKSLSDKLSFFEYALTQLSDDLPCIMYDLMIQKYPWDELSAKYHVSKSMIGKYRKKAVRELTDIYEVRDNQMLQYMLS
jgi:hypothetical protein